MGTMPDDLRMELSAPMVLYARAEAAEAQWAALKEYLDQRITMDEAYRNVRDEMRKLERGQ